MILTRKYDLPDVKILANDDDSFCVWIPDKTYVILGASNSSETSVNAEKANVDSISILKRSSGGQAVVLTAKMIVFSVLRINPIHVEPKIFFQSFNLKLIEMFESIGISDVEQRGISDLAIRGKKIMGSAIYRKRDKFFYHAVLNVSEEPNIIADYLLHPSKEPDYREGRSHLNFITSLMAEQNKVDINILKSAVEQCLSSYILG